MRSASWKKSMKNLNQINSCLNNECWIKHFGKREKNWRSEHFDCWIWFLSWSIVGDKLQRHILNKVFFPSIRLIWLFIETILSMHSLHQVFNQYQLGMYNLNVFQVVLFFFFSSAMNDYHYSNFNCINVTFSTDFLFRWFNFIDLNTYPQNTYHLDMYWLTI